MKYLKLFLLTVFLLSLQSCFDITEEITLNRNESGHYRFSLNLSKVRTKVKSVMRMEKFNGHEVPTKKEINLYLDKLLRLAKNTEGISKVKITRDFTNYVVNIECDFQKISNLNKIVENIKLQNKLQKELSTKHFSYNPKTNKFQRLSVNNFQKDFKKIDKKIFIDANYTLVYRFQDPIKKQSNPYSKLAKNKKASLLRSSILELINGTKNLKNNIQLTP